MGKNKSIQHKHIIKENSKGDLVEIFYHKHYDSEGYSICKVNGKKVEIGLSFETLERAIKASEDENALIDF